MLVDMGTKSIWFFDKQKNQYYTIVDDNKSSSQSGGATKVYEIDMINPF